MQLLSLISRSYNFADMLNPFMKYKVTIYTSEEHTEAGRICALLYLHM
jgi:hypothetical protein